MKWEYIGTGLALIGIGVTLILALPPPWLPKMSAQLVQVGVIGGVVLLLVGACLLILGVIPALPSGKMGPVFLISLGIVSAIAGAIWYAVPDSAPDDGQLVARLAELGWTVKPSPDEIQFELTGYDILNGRPLPPMEESATYFAQLKKPFTLLLQGVSGLNGLHYLADIGGCKKIAIAAVEFTDISELQGFGHLTSLTISQMPASRPGVVDPSVLSSLTNLTELNLPMTRIRTLDFAASLKKLRVLNVGQTSVGDLSPLSKIEELEKLDVRDTRVTDLSPLANNPNLRELMISGAQISSLASLTSLNNLKTVSIIEQTPIDLTAVGQLKKLETLSIWGPLVLDIRPIGNLSNLRSLQISGFGLGPTTVAQNMQVIGNLKELRTLALGQLQLTSIDFVQSLTSLTELSLAQLLISSLAPVRGLPSLSKVALTDIRVADISPLLSLPRLSELTLIRIPARGDIVAQLERNSVAVRMY
ncbi:leucine-rich repeat domain-containing protein [Bradyrhizobium sp. SZCCHNPS2010]|uniref:leucine-rich repeat domain-containing protein n=1 Tax=Bradyrhizobium sp. SZCCHNPS2010 TaxID=3057333 RepID=UPI002916C5AD|nr:leucine-rich repeat domain-containing protein [Bradyrhizobium sp. SZCCHNPS2010]